MKQQYTNHLINESSSYLLMHAHNPVDWYAWGAAAFQQAEEENKLIIISIGYAACHWCHVMEQESFEDVEVARLMNEHFVSIKIDREERPDIDQVYMTAVQLLTGRGGWPLNAFALPDGKCFYAAAYFPRDAWISLLQQIIRVYKIDPGKVVEQAQAVTQGVRAGLIVEPAAAEVDFKPAELDDIFAHWEKQIDFQWGGSGAAPKFPAPIAYRYLLKYANLTGNEKAFQAVKTTLDKMALGGIYDQVGGGFARYSTDRYWRVPHFEKMLYDNAQLAGLYATAYQATRDPLYKQVVYETLEFIERELMMSSSPAAAGGHGFYSSLDADSEGEEGRYYTWTKSEIEKLLLSPDDPRLPGGVEAPGQKFFGGARGAILQESPPAEKNASLIISYFNITQAGNWENGRNILWRDRTDEEFAKENGIGIEALRESATEVKAKLSAQRLERVKPAVDNKVLASWNALLLDAYVDAYRVFADDNFLEKALGIGKFLVEKMILENGRMNRIFIESKNVSAINAFLDDYAFTIKAFISLYQAVFDENWLFKADKLLRYVLEHFSDKGSGMFYYTSDLDSPLIARKIEVTDDVIPASNSALSFCLYLLGEYFHKEEYIRAARRMLNNVRARLATEGSYFANWANLTIYFIESPTMVTIVGEDCIGKRKELDRYFLPHVIFSGSSAAGSLPILDGKSASGRTVIYVCKDKTCLQPAAEAAAALRQIESLGAHTAFKKVFTKVPGLGYQTNICFKT